MIVNEKFLDPLFDGGQTIHDVARMATYVLAIAGVLGMGWYKTRKQES